QTYESQFYAPQYYSAPAEQTYESGYYGTQRDSIPADAALINLTVPTNAEVWFSGDKTTSTGGFRSFVTPPLESGHNFAYQLRVRWMEDGQPRERVEKPPVRPGERLNLRID